MCSEERKSEKENNSYKNEKISNKRKNEKLNENMSDDLVIKKKKRGERTLPEILFSETINTSKKVVT